MTEGEAQSLLDRMAIMVGLKRPMFKSGLLDGTSKTSGASWSATEDTIGMDSDLMKSEAASFILAHEFAHKVLVGGNAKVVIRENLEVQMMMSLERMFGAERPTLAMEMHEVGEIKADNEAALLLKRMGLELPGFDAVIATMPGDVRRDWPRRVKNLRRILP